ncbi:hypothetical protein CASFOL_029819 [Castilleja foliolosa]|uniref:Mitochondrial import inner membrane translocase subunit TIM22 n=1 Tax=Castilleja foliolosa TaxID=1961234 RepID=A0ABD3C8W9_9LAMI
MSSNLESESQNASSSTQEAPKPVIEPIHLPTIEEIRGQDIWNNCAVRSVVSGVMGGGLGLFMGLFLGALDNPIMQDQMSGKQQFIYQASRWARGAGAWRAPARPLPLWDLSSLLLNVSSRRSKHDITNTFVAGCVTGGSLSARGGQKRLVLGVLA